MHDASGAMQEQLDKNAVPENLLPEMHNLYQKRAAVTKLSKWTAARLEEDSSADGPRGWPR